LKQIRLSLVITYELIRFEYCYLFRDGFLNGKPALIDHFLYALWYPLLMDLNYLELKKHLDGHPGAIVREALDLEVPKSLRISYANLFSFPCAA